MFSNNIVEKFYKNANTHKKFREINSLVTSVDLTEKMLIFP